MRRLVSLLVLLLALSAAPALGQSNPFQPLPPPPVNTPAPTVAVPTAAPDDNLPDPDDEPSRGLLLGIAGLVAILFAGIGIYITRDARKSLTDADRRAVDRAKEGLAVELTPAQKHELRRQKQKARRKGKAQRQARKAQRKR